MRGQEAPQKRANRKFQACHSWRAYFYCLLMFERFAEGFCHSYWQ